MTIKVKRDRRSRDACMGRFGGGWQWKVGAQAGDLSRERGTVIVNLLTFSVRISWET
jgi:hypothetical protein